jgi:hypothetical protein
MDLEKRLLKDIFRRRAVAQEAHQEMEQLALIALDERGETGVVAIAVGGQVILIGLFGNSIHVPFRRSRVQDCRIVGAAVGPIRCAIELVLAVAFSQQGLMTVAIGR